MNYIIRKHEVEAMPGLSKTHFLNDNAQRINKSLISDYPRLGKRLYRDDRLQDLVDLEHISRPQVGKKI